MYFQLTEFRPVVLLSPSSVEGTETHMPSRKHHLIDKSLLTRLYFDEERSLRAIVVATGTNYRLVRDSFKAHGLSWRSKSEARAGRPWDDVTRAKIASTRSGQKDAPEVAARKRRQLSTAGGRGWNKGLTAATDERVARQRDASVVVMHTPEFRARASQAKAAQIEAGGYWDRGYVETQKSGRLYFMSSWERRRWLELDADPDVVQFTRHPCRIPYQWEGNQHLYLPDVLIGYTDGSKVLEEIKPRALLDRPHKGQSRLLAKVQAGVDHAASQGWGWRIFSYDGEGGASFISS